MTGEKVAGELGGPEGAGGLGGGGHGGAGGLGLGEQGDWAGNSRKIWQGGAGGLD
jgi:hypothetical protein